MGLFDILISPLTDVVKAVTDPLGEDEPDGNIPPIVRALIPGASMAKAIVDEVLDDND